MPPPPHSLPVRIVVESPSAAIPLLIRAYALLVPAPARRLGADRSPAPQETTVQTGEERAQ